MSAGNINAYTLHLFVVCLSVTVTKAIYEANHKIYKPVISQQL